MPEIRVVGSSNVDTTLRVPELPAPGETLAATGMLRTPGGKGLNQAVAASRGGGRVRMAGALGEDADGDLVLGALERSGVDASAMRRTPEPTGTATILVDDAGENVIVLMPGANGVLGEGDAAALLGSAGDGDLVVLQGEIPGAANRAVAALARGRGARVLWNAAPAPRHPDDVVTGADLVVVNEGELAALAALLGADAEADADDVERRAGALAERLGATVVVTLGANGALSAGAAGVHRAAAPRVAVVDTTGAGDVFVGVLAVALQEGESLERAMTGAAAAGALAVTRPGADCAPTRAEIARLLHP